MFGKSAKNNTPPASKPAAAPAPAAPTEKQESQARTTRVDTSIGSNTIIDGDLQFSGGLHVEGFIKGNMTANDENATLILNEQGRIQGEVRVASMVVNGSIEGDVFATGKVELFEKARVCGDVYYNLLEMAVGAEVNGKLVRQKPSEIAPDDNAGVAPQENGVDTQS